MVKKFGEHPANARVDVDYSGKKPKVKFSYPQNGDSPKKQALKQHSLGYHSFLIMIILYSLFGLFLYYPQDITYPTECSATFNQNNLTTSVTLNNISAESNSVWVSRMNVTCDNQTVEYYLTSPDSRFSGYESKFAPIYPMPLLTLFILIFSVILLIFVFLFLNKLVTRLLLKSKRYKNWFPSAQANGVLFKRGKKKYQVFKPKDVINNEVLIPYFSNVELDYKTTGDFNKYLKRIIIREDNFKEYLVKNKKIGMVCSFYI
jgi:hypothetical protein